MFLLRYSTAVHLLVSIIASGAASGEEVMKAVGDQVSFRPDKPLPPPPPPPSVTSIIWKHRNISGVVVKAIEWDEDGLNIPNSRFKDITTLDVKTGQITITGLKVEHGGVYTIDINSKEQEQRFTLTIKERVPKPVIMVEKTAGPDVVYLRCEYSEPIIWKNSTGHILTGSPIIKGESITVKKNGHPENFYTCTLDNGASKETSDPVYERNLFDDESNSVIGPGVMAIIVIIILILFIIGGIVLYKFNEKFKGCVAGIFPCIKGQYTPANNGAKMTEDKDKSVIPSQNTDETNVDTNPVQP